MPRDKQKNKRATRRSFKPPKPPGGHKPPRGRKPPRTTPGFPGGPGTRPPPKGPGRPKPRKTRRSSKK